MPASSSLEPTPAESRRDMRGLRGAGAGVLAGAAGAPFWAAGAFSTWFLVVTAGSSARTVRVRDATAHAAAMRVLVLPSMLVSFEDVDREMGSPARRGMVSPEVQEQMECQWLGTV